MYARVAARIGATRQVAQLWRCTACLAVHLHRSCTFCGRVTCVELVSTRLAWVSFLARNAALANFKQPWVRRRVLHVRPASTETATVLQCRSHRRARLVQRDCTKQSQGSSGVHRARRVASAAMACYRALHVALASIGTRILPLRLKHRRVHRVPKACISHRKGKCNACRAWLASTGRARQQRLERAWLAPRVRWANISRQQAV